jgi:hypothetical protein
MANYARFSSPMNPLSPRISPPDDVEVPRPTTSRAEMDAARNVAALLASSRRVSLHNFPGTVAALAASPRRLAKEDDAVVDRQALAVVPAAGTRTRRSQQATDLLSLSEDITTSAAAARRYIAGVYDKE